MGQSDPVAHLLTVDSSALDRALSGYRCERFMDRPEVSGGGLRTRD
jgi:hypothetical protein